MENQILPVVLFKFRERNAEGEFDWVAASTNDLFAGKKVVVFSLPGAFTPTCSNFQVPAYEALYNEFVELGVDAVYCVSVNDAFVMNAWAKKQVVEKVKFIPDGSAEFTEGMGMLVRKDNLGFGARSWRYAMVVNDGVVEKMFVEPGLEDNCPTDPYGESAPETVLEYLRG
jgi:peroxiredoxin